MVDPIAVRLGPVQLHWYGIIMAFAVLAGALLGLREARRRHEDPDEGWAMLVPALALGLVGARLYHVVHEWGTVYASDPWLIPQIWNGGLGIIGAIAGGALAIFAVGRARRLSAARWLDIFAPALLLGQVVGRLGSWVNQDLFGPPTQLPWGVPIDALHRAGTPWDALAYPLATTRFQPLFAYEALLNLVGLVLLLWLARRLASRLYDGDVALLYLVWYGAVRVALEPFRSGAWVVAGLPMGVWLGVGAVVLAGAFVILRHRRGWGTPGAWQRSTSQTDADVAPTSTTPELQPG